MKQALQTSVIGSYPVIIDTRHIMEAYFQEQPVLWEPYIEQAVQGMVRAGIRMVSDGQTRDPFIQLFTRHLHGCRIRDRTEIIGPVEYKEPITVADQRFVRRLLPRKTQLIGVITGPFTLAKSSVDHFYHDEKQLCFDFAAALRTEAELLQKQVDLISIDEPFFSNQFPEYAKELLRVLTQHLSCPTRLHVCGDVSAIVPQLGELPVDILSHEFKASPFLFDVFREHPCSKNICVGAVRSDDLRVEPVAEIVSHIEKARGLFGEKMIQIAPDCGQRLLPQAVAFEKLSHLCQAGGIINGR
jgi:5-methyltetrahydropteroyltriglutamate--homocysteine methyltransferase